MDTRMKSPRMLRLSLATTLSVALMATLMPLAPASATSSIAAPSEISTQALSVDSAVHIAARKIQRDPSRTDVFVNKSYPLSPKKYAPKTVAVPGTNVRLKSSASSAYTTMVKAAAKDGVKIRAVSGYRSYARQAELYNYYTRIYGQSYASKISAVPGTSEHQTGLAIDVGNNNSACGLQACFADTPVGRWVAKNAHKYGFILRYPKGQESITGYSYEPWHFRYLGTSLAKSYKNSGAKTLDAYYGVAGSKSTTPPSKSAKGTAKTSANLNMRSGAGTGNRILLTIPNGKTVKLTGSKNSGWYQVQYSSKTGWVSGKYLKNISMPSNTSKDTPKKDDSKTIKAKSAKTTENLNMRSGNGTNHRIILTIPKGKKVSVTGSKKSGWYPVKYAGKNGWASGKYLR